jgi:hypothetical protein
MNPVRRRETGAAEADQLLLDGEALAAPTVPLVDGRPAPAGIGAGQNRLKKSQRRIFPHFSGGIRFPRLRHETLDQSFRSRTTVLPW